MTKKERMLAALYRQQADRVPKGELLINANLANHLLDKDYPLDFFHLNRDREVRELLGIDFINLGDWPTEDTGLADAHGNKRFRSIYGEEYVFNGQSKHIVKPPFEDIEDAYAYPIPDIKRVSGDVIEHFSQNSDLFITAQIGGPISMINEMVGMEEYFVYCMLNQPELIALGEKIMEYEIAKAKLFIDKRADAILVADDMAFNSGTFVNPEVLRKIAFPFYAEAIRQIKAYKDVPVILHTDGNINAVMDDIVYAGFDGLHSLQPSAGMDIAKIKREYGDALCLIGNIDLDYVMPFGKPDEVERAVRATIDDAAPGGGYILSTCNILYDELPLENVRTMYQTAHDYGVYK